MVRQIVDKAITAYTIEKVVKQLSALDDEFSAAGVGKKIYPGLVGHVFPTNRFRNTFEIKPPSPYVARA